MIFVGVNYLEHSAEITTILKNHPVILRITKIHFSF